jgi:hypothetical protein
MDGRTETASIPQMPTEKWRWPVDLEEVAREAKRETWRQRTEDWVLLGLASKLALVGRSDTWGVANFEC